MRNRSFYIKLLISILLTISFINSSFIYAADDIIDKKLKLIGDAMLRNVPIPQVEVIIGTVTKCGRIPSQDNISKFKVILQEGIDKDKQGGLGVYGLPLFNNLLDILKIWVSRAIAGTKELLTQIEEKQKQPPAKAAVPAPAPAKQPPAKIAAPAKQPLAKTAAPAPAKQPAKAAVPAPAPAPAKQPAKAAVPALAPAKQPPVKIAVPAPAPAPAKQPLAKTAAPAPAKQPAKAVEVIPTKIIGYTRHEYKIVDARSGRIMIWTNEKKSRSLIWSEPKNLQKYKTFLNMLSCQWTKCAKEEGVQDGVQGSRQSWDRPNQARIYYTSFRNLADTLEIKVVLVNVINPCSEFCGEVFSDLKRHVDEQQPVCMLIPADIRTVSKVLGHYYYRKIKECKIVEDSSDEIYRLFSDASTIKSKLTIWCCIFEDIKDISVTESDEQDDSITESDINAICWVSVYDAVKKEECASFAFLKQGQDQKFSKLVTYMHDQSEITENKVKVVVPRVEIKKMTDKEKYDMFVRPGNEVNPADYDRPYDPSIDNNQYGTPQIAYFDRYEYKKKLPYKDWCDLHTRVHHNGACILTELQYDYTENMQSRKTTKSGKYLILYFQADYGKILVELILNTVAGMRGRMEPTVAFIDGKTDLEDILLSVNPDVIMLIVEQAPSLGLDFDANACFNVTVPDSKVSFEQRDLFLTQLIFSTLYICMKWTDDLLRVFYIVRGEQNSETLGVGLMYNTKQKACTEHPLLLPLQTQGHLLTLKVDLNLSQDEKLARAIIPSISEQ